jgi:hypothetical protein
MTQHLKSREADEKRLVIQRPQQQRLGLRTADLSKRRDDLAGKERFAGRKQHVAETLNGSDLAPLPQNEGGALARVRLGMTQGRNQLRGE